MKFYAQQGNHYWFINEVAAAGHLDGVVIPSSYPVAPTYLESLRELGKELVLDPQTYKLGHAQGSRTQRFERTIDEQTMTLARLRDPDERERLVARVVGVAAEIRPDILVSPYFYARSVEQPWFQGSLELAELTREYAERERLGSRVFAGVFVAGSEVKEAEARDRLLTRITGRDIDGVYFIVDPEQNDNAPILDGDLIHGLRESGTILRDNGVEVIVAYTDMVGLGLLAFTGASFASGIRNSLRKLRVSDQFRAAPRHMQAPAKRCYAASLLNNIRVTGELATVVRLGLDQHVKCGCEFCNSMLTRYDYRNEGTFSNDLASKHFMAAVSEEVRRFRRLPEAMRAEAFLERLEAAQQSYEELLRAGVHFDRDSGRRHLSVWQDAFTRS